MGSLRFCQTKKFSLSVLPKLKRGVADFFSRPSVEVQRSVHGRSRNFLPVSSRSAWLPRVFKTRAENGFPLRRYGSFAVECAGRIHPDSRPDGFHNPCAK